MNPNGPGLSSPVFLDRVGEVVLNLNSTRLSWNPVSFDPDTSSCCTKIFHNEEAETEIRFSDVYASEYAGLGFINGCSSYGGSVVLGNNTEMYRFVVHGFQRGKKKTSPFILSSYTFGHRDLQTCRAWLDQINDCIKVQVGRPKNLLVFVHPRCGKRNGCKTWATVAPLFSLANVATKVIVTQRAGHAFDTLKFSMDRELRSFDGIIAVGGDGLFNEILNGLLSSRHKAPFSALPTMLDTSVLKDQLQKRGYEDNNTFKNSLNNHRDIFLETTKKGEDIEPLLSDSESHGLNVSKLTTTEQESCYIDQSTTVCFPNDWLRLGIIPAGSTDAIVISTTGMRDPVTSALHIILGSKIFLDVAQVVRWKTTPSSVDSPSVRYAASFAGYGFYGNVIKDSEKYRWMGPFRYDFIGTKVFFEHRVFEAEIDFLEAKVFETVRDAQLDGTTQALLTRKKSNRVCRANCTVCVGATKSSFIEDGSIDHADDSRWLQRKGRFLSIGAAVISCRNERAPDGLVADAHLSDGFLHLILVKDCSRPFYLWHLTKLTRRGSNPLDFNFVEHHKTHAFTFVANHDESVWNLDGELFQACQVTVRACRGLINLFASGPEV